MVYQRIKSDERTDHTVYPDQCFESKKGLEIMFH